MKSDTLERNKIEYGYSSWENVGLPQFIETPRPGISLNDCYTADKGRPLPAARRRWSGCCSSRRRLIVKPAQYKRSCQWLSRLSAGGLISNWRGQERFRDEAGIVFQPGVNEELAATALWGSQHIGFTMKLIVTGCSRSGMARDRGLTGRWMHCVMPIRAAWHQKAAWSSLWVMIPRENRRRWRISRIRVLWPSACRISFRGGLRTSSPWGSKPLLCHVMRAAVSG